MPVVPPPPVSVVIAAPIHLIDRLIEVGGLGDGCATYRRRQARRHAHKADAQPTSAAMKIARIFYSPCVLKRRRPSASHVLAFGDRVLRSEIRPAAPRSSVDRLVAKSPRTATTNAIGSKLRPPVRTMRGWVIHRLFIAWPGINSCTWLST